MIYRAAFGLLSVLVCLTAAALSQAQELPKPGQEHEKLKKLEGAWDAVLESQGQKHKATATYKSICGGMWMASDFQGDLGGIAYSGHGLDGYDQQKKKYVGVWVQSMSSAPMHYEGNLDDKDVLVMTGTACDLEGKPEQFKNTTAWKDDDHFSFKMYMVDAEGKEQLAFTIEYARKK
ncbi:MAG: DUF1579 domain-containing protein [Pirellulales bacterium]